MISRVKKENQTRLKSSVVNLSLKGQDMSFHIDKKEKKILVVEDDLSVLEIVSQTLQAENYQVEKATSADEAIEKLKSYRPHLVLTDNDMPGL